MQMRSAFLASLALATTFANLESAPAQIYPSRAITLVVPLAAGGPIDTTARIVAAGMQASLGQSIIIENITGASGSIGVGRVARAAPDGYTICLGQWGTNMANGAIYPLQYDIIAGTLNRQPYRPLGSLTRCSSSSASSTAGSTSDQEPVAFSRRASAGSG